eukprot:TRINITY_DN3525_c0_g1_i1.p1 TRINITY_DN3525_c0_g1~~TRINITY_DN3525_c0_g1_i1.p1  ORF type:complete len:328 (+),score=67.78 TRINITY_DN3525_c0_g1_i1:65-1048(+)
MILSRAINHLSRRSIAVISPGIFSNQVSSIHKRWYSGEAKLNAESIETELLKRYQSDIPSEIKEMVDVVGWDALHWASFKGEVNAISDVVKLRQEQDPSLTHVFTQDKAGVSPLHLAVSRGKEEAVEILLKAGCDPNVKDKKPQIRLTPIQLAVRSPKPSIKIIESLIQAGADVNSEATDKTTPLFIAVRSGNVDVVQLLLKHGANINIQDNPPTSGWTAYRVTTPLHIAVSAGNEELVKILISHGGNPNLQLMDDVGETLLHVAALMHRKSIAELLINSGADINAKDCFEGTPLDYAKSITPEEQDKDLIDFLTQRGAKDGKGRRF